ncbi:transcription repressor NadR [Salinicoccus carnicancri]|uniref:transcription repressor NadR n=1 Tax=Salinicoccus carnicancri TaxID=558170 RepID=UPI00030225BA|nr:transcription repressor NadR [Salinicoccus carnicancri]
MTTAEKRRAEILKQLNNTGGSISGTKLAEQYDVSRQIIVRDISILKADGHPIVSTSRGYVLRPAERTGKPFKRTIACQHNFEHMAEELQIILDNGAMIDNVSIDHPVYGEMTGELMIATNEEMTMFLTQMHKEKSRMLANLTDNIHLHRISADTKKILDNAVRDLIEHGYIIQD